MEVKTHGLFLKTYSGDLKWLPYLFRSLNKFVTGFDGMTIVTDKQSEVEQVNAIIQENAGVWKDRCHVVSSNKPYSFHGYGWQQLIKLTAYNYCTYDYLTFIDSDCIFQLPMNHKDLFHEGKPVVLKTTWEQVRKQGTIYVPWQETTAEAIGFIPDWEYMRRNPFTYSLDTLRNLTVFMKDIYKYISERDKPGQFSEFNLIGAYAEKYEPEAYHFHDTAFGLPPEYIAFFWSWSGVNDGDLTRIHMILL